VRGDTHPANGCGPLLRHWADYPAGVIPAPYYSLSFRDPEGIRLEVNHVPGKGLLEQGARITPAG